MGEVGMCVSRRYVGGRNQDSPVPDHIVGVAESCLGPRASTIVRGRKQRMADATKAKEGTEERESRAKACLRSYQSIGSPVKAFVMDTVMVSACNSQAAACDMMSHMSSCAALGNIVICSINGSLHAAF